MDIEIRKDVLLRALDRCLYPSDKKDDSGREYCGRVMLTVNAQDVTANFYAIDTFLCVDTAVPLESVNEEGRQAVDTRRLHVMATNLIGDVIHLVVRNEQMTVTSDYRRRYTAQVIDPDLFPKLQEPSAKATSITIAGPKLAYILKRAGHSTDPDRPNLDGVQINVSLPSGRAIPVIEAISINGYKLVWVKHTEAIEGTLPFKAFLPNKLLKPLLALAETEKSVTLYCDPPRVYAMTEDSLLGALLPQGEFFDYEQMVSNIKPMEAVCHLPTIALRDTLKAIDAIRSEKTSCVRFRFDGGSLLLDLVNDSSRASDSIPVRAAGNIDSFEFLANPRYVLDHLKGADSDCILYSTAAPVAFETTDGYLGFLSPIHKESMTLAVKEIDEAPAPSETPRKKTKASSDSDPDEDPGPGKGRKKKASKKPSKPRAGMVKAEDINPDDLRAEANLPVEDDDEDDGEGSADPSQYL